MEPIPMLSADPAGTRMRVWVVPGASRTEVVGVHGEAVKVRVAAPADAGRANTTMLRLLSDRTGAFCVLLGGHGSRQKTVLIEGLEPREVAEVLGMDPSSGT